MWTLHVAAFLDARALPLTLLLWEGCRGQPVSWARSKGTTAGLHERTVCTA
jgi:hypothetical protein